VRLGLPLRSMEVEFGPSQVEMTLAPLSGHLTADAMVLFRSCIKQVCARHGYHATFMCRPAIKNLFSSGWHLHQSLVDAKSGANLFTSNNPRKALSPKGFHWLAGLLAHAPGATALTTPTINGYKRFRPLSLAPDRITWGQDNRGVMLRVLGETGEPAARIENRVGEPAANPYLYLASQIASGLDGIEHALDPGASADTPYEGSTPLLPRTLRQALDALRADADLCAALGPAFVDYFSLIKESEIARAGADAASTDVTEWEQREYFEIF
jgi:glutamine synthetase